MSCSWFDPFKIVERRSRVAFFPSTTAKPSHRLTKCVTKPKVEKQTKMPQPTIADWLAAGWHMRFGWCFRFTSSLSLEACSCAGFFLRVHSSALSLPVRVPFRSSFVVVRFGRASRNTNSGNSCSVIFSVFHRYSPVSVLCFMDTGIGE